MTSTLLASLRRVLMGVCFAVVAVLLLVPNTFLKFLRMQYRWIGMPMNWIELHSGFINLAHVFAFLTLGFAATLGMPTRLPRVLGIIVSVAIGSEIAQFWVPGRTPRVSDVGVDVGGALAGIACAGALLWLARGKVRGDTPSSQ